MTEDLCADDVRAAANRLSGACVRTPLLENAYLNELTGGRILLKAECLQLGSAFKFRGAYNLISQLSPAQRARGVLAWSSGNHAQGVARAAKIFGTPATIVMPQDAPSIKIDMVRYFGAEIVYYDRYTENREEIGQRIATTHGYTIAPPFDHPAIIAGQGTLALEATEQAKELGAAFDQFITPCGGGGLAAGCATILEEIAPDCEFIIAEPAGYDDAWRSIESGSLVTLEKLPPTVCDSIATPQLGSLTFPILQRRVGHGSVLNEEEILRAVHFAFRQLKLVVEPGGAAGLASVLFGKIDCKKRTVCVVLSGGNVDATVFAKSLQTACPSI